MNSAEAYIPTDRRAALLTQQELPTTDWGAVLFVDISGFTPLTGALQRAYGPRRGAEELTRQLNRVYTALIDAVEAYNGSVIGFSGDAITCWFGENDDTQSSTPSSNHPAHTPILAAVSAALALQTAMAAVQAITLAGGSTIRLGVKAALAAGMVRRFIVGDPAIQLIDVLAGTTLDRMAAAEQLAQQGELVLDAATAALVQAELVVEAWRAQPAAEDSSDGFAVVSALRRASVRQRPPPLRPLPEKVVRSWVLPAIYERIQNQQGRFLAELRPAAALFVKFTGIDYDGDSAAPAKLNSYVNWMQRIINQHEGALIQLTTGDKGSYLYAAFGAPIAHDDDMVRATAVGLALRQPPPECPFISSIQIGISYGMMRVGAYGSEGRRTYGVLGNETIMAARLMTHAQPGQVVVSAVVAEAISDRYEVVALGSFQLKGKSEAQPLFAVLQPQLESHMSKKLYTTPLVGREAELALLTQVAAQVQAAQGQIVRIEGNAGLGKSHLVAAFTQLAQGMGFHVVVAGGQSTAQDTAYFVIRQLMQMLLGLEAIGEQRVEAQIATLTRQLTTANPSWSLRIPLLGDLLGLPLVDNATTAAFDARLRQEALVTLTVEIFQHYAQQQKRLLLLEDIHWLDEASQGIVLALARTVPNMPLLLLLVHRPSVREQETFLTQIAALPAQTHIALPELTALGTSELVGQRLQGTISGLAASLIQIQAQGNPFFTEELVDALLESDQLQQQGAVWTLAPALQERLRNAGCLLREQGEEVVNPAASLSAVDLGMPSTIQGIILARLDRLPEPVKLTVKVASVIGRVFSHDLLLQAHPVAALHETLDQEVATLLAREFARLEAPAPRPVYIFKHNITQEVVYQTLLSDQRNELHLGVATALERLQPESIEALALHYYNSNLEQPPIRDKALHYLEAAGIRTKHDYANETALSYFERALGLATKADWLKAKVEILHILGRRAEEEQTITQLAEVAEAKLGEVALLRGSYYEAVSDYEQAQQSLEQALIYHREHNDVRGEVKCMSQLGLIFVRQGDYEAAQHSYQRALALTQQSAQANKDQAPLLYGLSVVNRQLGNYPAAISHLQTALGFYRDADNRQGEAQILNALGTVAYLQRDYGQAETFYRQALTIQQMIGDRAGESGSLMSLGQTARTQGDYSKAATLIADAMTMFQAQNNRWWEKIGQIELGIIALLTGNLSLATGYFEQGVELSRAIGDTTGEAIALLNLGQTKRDQADYASAQAMLLQSKRIADQQGDKELTAQCWSDLALCSLYLGRFQETIERSQQALALFTALKIQAALTTELCTLAEAYLQLQQPAEAAIYINQAFQLLNELGGEGPDYPQRDYLVCYRIFKHLAQFEAAHLALAKADFLRQQKAQQISDQAMRTSFLENVAFNRQIQEAVAQQAHLVQNAVSFVTEDTGNTEGTGNTEQVISAVFPVVDA